MGEADAPVQEFLELLKAGRLKEAEECYVKQLYPAVEARFVSETAKTRPPDYDLLVLPLGSRWSIPALLIKALKPREVCFLCTKERANTTLNKVIEVTGLSPNRYKVVTTEYAKMDLATVYDAIKSVIKPYYGKRIAIDLSRGKRVMSAGLAVVGAFYYCDLVYIDEDWDGEARDGIPLTEELVVVRNPFKIMGELEMNYARELFNRNNFQAAGDIYDALLNKVQDPRAAQVHATYAKGFGHWDLFNYSAALMHLRESEAKAKQFFVELSLNKGNLTAITELSEIQNRPGRLIDALKEENTAKRLFCDVYANALRRADNKRYDEAIARLYRGIEIVSQHRLAKRGIDSAAPDYAQPHLAQAVEGFRTASEKAYGMRKEPPHAIALLDGHLLLYALGDDLWSGKSPEELRNLVNAVKARDHSMSAHGIRPVSAKDVISLKAMADEFGQRLFNGDAAAFRLMLAEHTFPKIV